MEIKEVAVDKLIPYEFNNKIHSADQINKIANSIKEFWFTQPIVIDKNNFIIIGHWRLEGAKKLWLKKVPVVVMEDLTDQQIKKLRILDNKLNESDWDVENLKLELIELPDLNIGDLDIDINDMFGDLLEDYDLAQYREKFEDKDGVHKNQLLKKFGVAPFSIFDTTSANRQDRKKMWLDTGIQSELGREGELAYNNKKLSSLTNDTGTSVFDPVLAEICYKWFNIDGGTILDPFAWWSVRWIVAGKLWYHYYGNDLRQEQIDANKAQLNLIDKDNGEVDPVWTCWDSLNIGKLLSDVEADMVFSCPPYADLEVYSDDPKDLSNMEYAKFKEVYSKIISETCNKLKENRFAVFVVSEVRWKGGNFYWFVQDTIDAFTKAGLKYYNEIILRNAYGTAPIRAGKSFVNRKVIRVHQNVLVFYKGDTKKIKDIFGEVDMGDFYQDDN